MSVLLAKPWQEARPGVSVKLLAETTKVQPYTGSRRRVVVILRGSVSWFTSREPLEVVIYPDLASDRVAEQLGGYDA